MSFINIIKMRTLILVLLLSSPLISLGESIDVEMEKFPGVKELVVESYNGHFVKEGYRTVYYFDDKGNAIKSSSFYKKMHLGSLEYQYNDKEFLLKKIQTYNINKGKEYEPETTSFIYKFDTNGRLICKIELHSTWALNKYYQDFDKNNNPQTIISVLDGRITTIKKEYDSLNREILVQRISNDTIINIEEKKYNEFGDIIYSNVPTLLDEKTGKMALLMGGNRFAIVEEYEYLYDSSNRWIEKYIIYDGKKNLIEKRIFK